jgi:hypothetical protein
MFKDKQALMLKRVPLFHDLNAQELRSNDFLTRRRLFLPKEAIKRRSFLLGTDWSRHSKPMKTAMNRSFLF